MSPETYDAALKHAKQELAACVIELGDTQARAEELELRIADLRQTVSVLSKLCGQEAEEIEDSLGLTDAIRYVFAAAGTHFPLIAQDVRLRLEGQGFNTRRYGNLLASIHTVIKRLADRGEIRPGAMQRSDGKPSYVWGGGMTPPPARKIVIPAGSITEEIANKVPLTPGSNIIRDKPKH